MLSEIVAAYLRGKRSEEIAREYREGYRKYPQTDEDLEWASIEAWPDDYGQHQQARNAEASEAPNAAQERAADPSGPASTVPGP